MPILFTGGDSLRFLSAFFTTGGLRGIHFQTRWGDSYQTQWFKAGIAIRDKVIYEALPEPLLVRLRAYLSKGWQRTLRTSLGIPGSGKITTFVAFFPRLPPQAGIAGSASLYITSIDCKT